MTLNRTQVVVLVSLAVSWLASMDAVIAVLRDPRLGVAGAAILFALGTGITAFLAAGVIRASRRMFYLLLILFALSSLSGLGRVIDLWRAFGLFSSDPLGRDFVPPAIATNLLVAAVTVALTLAATLAMILGLRRRGVWGAF